MFTVFDLKNPVRFSDWEEHHAREMLDVAKSLPVFRWLNDLDLDRIKFYYAPSMKMSDGVCGAFSMVYPDSVFLLDITNGAKNGSRPFWVEFLFPIIIHELFHCWQFTRHPALFVLSSLPLVRLIMLEPGASRMQKKADVFAKEYMQNLDSQEFEQRVKRWEGDNQ